jgi:alkylation response protein AidB-like acyl-CoA dehydrogenase
MLVKQIEETPLGYSPEVWKKMAELGWIGLVIPEEYGGSGLLSWI